MGGGSGQVGGWVWLGRCGVWPGGWGSGQVGRGSSQVGGGSGWVGGGSGWVGEVRFQSVDRHTHECYWFSSRQRHLDGPLRATINKWKAQCSRSLWVSMQICTRTKRKTRTCKILSPHPNVPQKDAHLPAEDASRPRVVAASAQALGRLRRRHRRFAEDVRRRLVAEN